MLSLIHIFYQKHNVSIRGGSEETTYYVSANYTPVSYTHLDVYKRQESQ